MALTVFFSSNFGIHVTYDQQHIVLRDLGDIVDFFVVLHTRHPCLLFQLHSWVHNIEWWSACNARNWNSDHSVIHRFPFYQGFCLFCGDRRSHIVYVFFFVPWVDSNWSLMVWWLEPVHQHLLIPKISTLYLLISLMTWASLDVSYMVRIFHAPTLILVLGPSKFFITVLTSCCRFTSGVVFLPVG